MNKTRKIFGISAIFFLSSVIFYIGFAFEVDEPYEIELIEIDPTYYLPTDEYFKFANLVDKNLYSELTLPILKTRFEKHPYVEKADILYESNGKIKVTLIEKKFTAMILNKGKNFVISTEFELLPVLPFSQNMMLPIINNEIDNNLKNFEIVSKNQNFIKAFKILDAARIINPVLFDKISEVDLLKDQNIEIFFVYYDFPTKLGEKDFVEKLYTFNILWNDITLQADNGTIQYVDLSYKNKVFVGLFTDDMRNIN